MMVFLGVLGTLVAQTAALVAWFLLVAHTSKVKVKATCAMCARRARFVCYPCKRDLCLMHARVHDNAHSRVNA